MKKVEIGDIVRANKLSLVYRITTLENKWVGRVTAVNEDGSFNAKTIESVLDNYGRCYLNLEPRYFDLVKRLKRDCVLVSDQTTILFDEDGKKHVSKCSNEEFDIEKGIMMCLCKKHGYTYQDIRRLLKNVEFKEVERRGSVLSNFVALCENPLASGTKFQDTRDIDANEDI
ncbi:hypothetical protein MKC88_10220 [[Clostridium] innocuum]|nr:hypothetical protein [[Clostridium] innocuum]